MCVVGFIFSFNFLTDGMGNQYYIDIWDFIIPRKGSLSWSNLITLSVWREKPRQYDNTLLYVSPFLVSVVFKKEPLSRLFPLHYYFTRGLEVLLVLKVSDGNK